MRTRMLSVRDYLLAGQYGQNTEHSLSWFQRYWRPIHCRRCYGIGPKFYALYDFAKLPEAQWPEFVVDEPYKTLLRRLSSNEQRLVTNDKRLFERHCRAHELPSIRNLGVIASEPPADLDSLPLIGDVSALAGVFSPSTPALFFKLIDASHGRKAFSAERLGNGVRWLDRHGSMEELFAYCQQQAADESGWLIQPRIRNHHLLRPLMGGGVGVGTIRIVTVLREQRYRVIGACLRIIVGDNAVDNFAHGASGNIAAAIDLDTGRMQAARGSRFRHWPVLENHDQHPQTGAPITGFTLPYWSETLALVERAHRSMPDVPTLGWDVAITDAGPVIIETNSTYDVDILQVTHQRGFKPALAAALGCNW